MPEVEGWIGIVHGVSGDQVVRMAEGGDSPIYSHRRSIV